MNANTSARTRTWTSATPAGRPVRGEVGTLPPGNASVVRAPTLSLVRVFTKVLSLDGCELTADCRHQVRRLRAALAVSIGNLPPYLPTNA